jgi:uncharacterized damage-inducible protein DinB
MSASASTALSVIDGLATQLGITQRTIKKNLEEVSHEESLVRPQPGGNSANWVLGHILASRSGLLKNLGEQPLLDEAAVQQYRRGSDGNVPNPVPLADLIAALDRSQPAIIAAMKRIPDAALAAKSPFASPAGAEATLAEALAGMVFHESYHVGQLGLLRRVFGKKGAI